jgi:hypothetical protein
MKALTKSSTFLFMALAATTHFAYGAQPPNVVSSDGSGNTAMGTAALANFDNGFNNTASGYWALFFNTTGSYNTASGASALFSNTIGNYNSASGVYSLLNNTTGNFNTASGYGALGNNQTGSYNTACGAQALAIHWIGDANTASGYQALYSDKTGSSNTAYGYQALGNNRTGDINTAQGGNALFNNVSGKRNVAVGYHALFDNTAGRDNTAIGAFAGRRITGSDNIAVANAGFAGESQTMRLGTQGSEGVIHSGVTRTFIAGIYGVTPGQAGTAIMVDSKGQLGTISSSRRYKQDIQPMADASERLQKLRPVKFHYIQPDDAGEKPIQYGLIAEEVAEVFPELVVLNEDGQPETVAYHLLPALLLNELQKEHQLNQLHTQQLALQEKQLAAQASQLADVSSLKRQLAEVKEMLAALQTQPEKVQVAAR